MNPFVSQWSKFGKWGVLVTMFTLYGVISLVHYDVPKQLLRYVTDTY